MKRLVQVVVLLFTFANSVLAQTTVPGGGSGNSAITAGTTATSGCTDGGFLYSLSNLIRCGANAVNDATTVTIGTGISGTGAALVVTNGTSTGNSLTIKDGSTETFSVADAGVIVATHVGQTTSAFRWVPFDAGTTNYNAWIGNEFAGTNSVFMGWGAHNSSAAGFIWYTNVTQSYNIGSFRGPGNVYANNLRNSEIKLDDNYELRQFDTTSTGQWTREFVKNAGVTLTDGAATTFATIAVASGDHGGGVIEYEVYATDATDHQSRTGFIRFNVVNKAGTETCTMTSVAGTNDTSITELEDGSGSGAISAGTLTYALTLTTAGTNTCAFQLNTASSITNAPVVTWQARFNGKLSAS